MTNDISNVPDELPVPKMLVPNGYRQGIITAITAFLTLSSAFLRFWAFDTEGPWDWLSVIVALLLSAAILLCVGALFRAINPIDDDRDRYIKTTRIFKFGVIVTMVGLLVSGIESEYYEQKHPELRKQSSVSFRQSLTAPTKASRFANE
jgi:hypothetical protein